MISYHDMLQKNGRPTCLHRLAWGACAMHCMPVRKNLGKSSKIFRFIEVIGIGFPIIHSFAIVSNQIYCVQIINNTEVE